MGARGHDDFVGLAFGQRSGGGELQQLVGRQIGQVVTGLEAVFSQRHQQGRGDALDLGQIVADLQVLAALCQFLFLLSQVGARPFAQFLGNLFIKPLDNDNILDGNEGHFLDRGKALGHQQMGDDVVNVQGVHEHLRAGLEFLRPAVGFLGLGQNVDVPAGKLRGQANVLTPPADGQAELFVGDHDLDAVGLFVEDDLGHLGRGQGVDDEGGRIGGPLDDVDFFALEFAYDGLNARAPHADARADRVDAGIVGNNRDLGPRSRIPGHRLDLDDAVIDFRHFLGKQLGHELRVGARQEDLRAASFLSDIDNIGPHPIAGVEVFTGDRFVSPEKGFGAAQVDDNVAIFDALDQAVNNFAGTVLVFLVLAAAFGVADSLNDHLLRRLRGDAPEIDGRQGVDQKIAGLGIGVSLFRRLEVDLGGLVLDIVRRFHDLDVADQRDFARLAVDGGANVVFMAVFRPPGFLDRLLHGFQNLFAFDSLVTGNGFRHFDQFGARLSGARFHGFAHNLLLSSAAAIKSSVRISFAL